MSSEVKKDPHRELCEVGARFLKRPSSANGHGCHYAIVEPSCYGENPDVFGVRHGNGSWDSGTFLLEAKVSRSDFLTDKKKPHRINPEKGVGKWRYYICPTGLIQPHEVPDKWGLIYVNKRGHVDVIKGALGVPMQVYEGWGGAKNRFRPYDQVKDNHDLFAFHERNIDVEVALLTMALVRIDGVEDAQYAIRRSLKLETEVAELKSTNRALENRVSSLESKVKYYRDKV